jgi:hypothetical protein
MHAELHLRTAAISGAMNSVLVRGLILMLAAGLQACCFRTGGTDGNSDAASSPSAIPAGTLEIANWGPRKTQAGMPFNVQSGGHAAIWIRVNHSLAGRTALIQFNDAFLEGRVSRDVVTAVVPEDSYAKPGVYDVRVIARAGDAYWGSSKVSFTVE